MDSFSPGASAGFGQKETVTRLEIERREKLSMYSPFLFLAGDGCVSPPPQMLYGFSSMAIALAADFFFFFFFLAP